MGENKEQKDVVRDALEKIRQNLDAAIELQASLAIIAKARYDALLKVGFTPKEALEICRETFPKM